MTSIFEELAKHPVLETERLILRPVSLEDAEEMFVYASDSENLRFTFPVSLEDAEEMFVYASDSENLRFTFPVNETIEVTRQNIAEIYLNSPLGRYGIVLKENNHFIGTIDFHHWKVEVRKAEIGYCLNKVYWNKGYATEALQALVHLSFNHLGLNCLIARHDKENPASGVVMKKAGFEFSHEEPYARRDPKKPERIITMCHYLLTKENYRKE